MGGGEGGVVVSQRGVSQTAGWPHDTPKEKITAHRGSLDVPVRSHSIRLYSHFAPCPVFVLCTLILTLQLHPLEDVCRKIGQSRGVGRRERGKPLAHCLLHVDICRPGAGVRGQG